MPSRDSKPKPDYFILPPSYRPLAFALSTAVVALVVWDKMRAPEEITAPHVGWDSEKVAVKSAAEAPPSIDVSRRLSAMDASGKGRGDEPSKKEDAANLGPSSTFGKHISAPGKPIGIIEERTPANSIDTFEPADGKTGVFFARSEEERSEINVRLYKALEEEKKRLGIARIMDRDVERDAAVPNAEAKRVAAPMVKAITLKNAETLRTAWAVAGLPGEPPEVDFRDQMAVFLAGPAGCGIVGIQNRTKFIVVLYNDSGFDDPSARVRAMPLPPKPVVVRLAK